MSSIGNFLIKLSSLINVYQHHMDQNLLLCINTKRKVNGHNYRSRTVCCERKGTVLLHATTKVSLQQIVAITNQFYALC